MAKALNPLLSLRKTSIASNPKKCAGATTTTTTTTTTTGIGTAVTGAGATTTGIADTGITGITGTGEVMGARVVRIM
jgi:hypothetical protein